MPIIFLVSGSTWNVPVDFDPAHNLFEVIGAGGNGGGSGNGSGWGGGGGGAYTRLANLALTPCSTVQIQIAAGGSQLPTTLKNSLGAIVLSGAPGMNGSQFGFGAGGDNSLCIPSGPANFGGDGGIADVGTGGGGGGGAAGPIGSGNGGGSPSDPPSHGTGGGGGGSNGGSSTPGDDGSTLAGGFGGQGTTGTGSGAGATASADAAPGTLGAGGGGGFSAGHSLGAAGGTDTSWDPSHGASGGGGGGGTDALGANVSGGKGGTYGGGGGGAGTVTGSGNVAGGIGGQGLIVVTYTSTAKANLSDKIISGIFGYSCLANLLGKRLDGQPAVYRNRLQQGSAFPAIVFQLISKGENYTFNSRLSTSYNRVQFTIWAMDPDTAENIEDIFFNFLDGFNPAGVRADLQAAANFVTLTRDGMYTETEPPQYWRTNDVMIFDNSQNSAV
jgi:hypothetical protein